MKKSIIVFLSITLAIALVIVGLGVFSAYKSTPIVKEYKEISAFHNDTGEKVIIISSAEIENSIEKYKIKITAKNGIYSIDKKFGVGVIYTYSVHWINDNIAVIRESNDGNAHACYIVDFTKKAVINEGNIITDAQFDITSKSGFTTIFDTGEQHLLRTYETKDELLYIFNINSSDNHFSFQQESYEEYVKYNFYDSATVGFRQNGKEAFTGVLEIIDEQIAVVTLDKKYSNELK